MATVERIPIYQDDIHSLPSDWAEVSSLDYGDTWMRNEVAVRKSGQIFTVSKQLVDQWGPGVVYGLLRPQPWSVTAENLRRRSTVAARLRRAWWQMRESLARRLDPERYDY